MGELGALKEVSLPKSLDAVSASVGMFSSCLLLKNIYYLDCKVV